MGIIGASKKGMGAFQIEYVSRDDAPISRRIESDKWGWLREEVSRLVIDGPVLRVRCPNKREMNSARDGVSKNKSDKYSFLPNGSKAFTRSKAVHEKDGEWYLYIGLKQRDQEISRKE